MRPYLRRTMMHEHESCECGVCKVPYFERNNYFHGKTLTARDLGAEQRYFNEKRWLINRMVIGWGVVCGLEVTLEGGCLGIAPGLALDCCGRELLVCEREVLDARVIAEALQVDPCLPSGHVRWALCLEYRECRREPVQPPSACDHRERGSEYNRIRDRYRLNVRRFEAACPDDHNEDCCPHQRLRRHTPNHQALVTRTHKCPPGRASECLLRRAGSPPDVPWPPDDGGSGARAPRQHDPRHARQGARRRVDSRLPHGQRRGSGRVYRVLHRRTMTWTDVDRRDRGAAKGSI